MKRDAEAMEDAGTGVEKPAEAKKPREEEGKSALVLMFEDCSTEYDELNDRTERIGKLNREIAVASKRLIFHMHSSAIAILTNNRLRQPKKWSKDGEGQHLVAQAHTHVSKILDLIHKIGDELHGKSYWRFQPSFSPGMQLFVESIAFLEYLSRGRLLSKEAIEDRIANSAPEKPRFCVALSDYLLGLNDLSGELMRHAINSVSMGEKQNAQRVAEFLRELNQGFCLLPWDGLIEKRLLAMRANLKKVEDACFALTLSGDEYPREMLGYLISENMG